MAHTPALPNPHYDALREFAKTYPETHEDFPWGHSAVKVRGKAFVFLSSHETGISVTTKLPMSREFAYGLPFASPTGYGLGKAGWMTARFDLNEEPPLGLLQAWIDESYRAVAPKKLVKTLPPAQLPFGEAP